MNGKFDVKDGNHYARVKFTLTEKFGFPCGFLRAVVTFGVAFFPMFYRLVDGRNKHFQHEKELEKQVAELLKDKAKNRQQQSRAFAEMKC